MEKAEHRKRRAELHKKLVSFTMKNTRKTAGREKLSEKPEKEKLYSGAFWATRKRSAGDIHTRKAPTLKVKTRPWEGGERRVGVKGSRAEGGV